jgi:steroid delta-isomerase-like uncharacterized protein
MKTESKSANEKVVRAVYQAAEVKDIALFVSLFADDGYFWDVAAGKKYYGKDIGKTVEVYAKAFPDMHRELYDFYVKDDENKVIVELSLNGTHNGPLELEKATIPATGKTIKVPCCDVWTIENGKIKSFNCYNAGTILLGQIGVL